MQLFIKYAINKSNGVVQIIDGRVRIPLGGWRGLTRIEAEHPDVVDALRRDWIDLVDHEPTLPENPPKKPIKLYNSDGVVQEMSPDELDKALTPKAESKKIGAEKTEEPAEEQVEIRPAKKRIPKT